MLTARQSVPVVVMIAGSTAAHEKARVRESQYSRNLLNALEPDSDHLS